MQRVVFFIMLFFCWFQSGKAQPGQPDSSFGTNGAVTTSLESYNSAAIQPDGKIVVVGLRTNRKGTAEAAVVARYDTNGRLDQSFSDDGKLLPDFGNGIRATVARSVAIQSDGKIIVAVTLVNGKAVPIGLARYNSNGSTDSSFGKDGKQITDFGNENFVESIAIQSDDKIVIAGYTRISDFPNRQNYNLLLARYTRDGSLDGSFSGDGTQIVDIGLEDRLNSVAIQGDGKIVVAGTIDNDFAVLRYNNDGSPDKTFSGDGKLTTHFGELAEANAVAIQANGKILAAGTYTYGNYSDIALSRYNTDGSPDKTFSSDGKQTVHFGENVNGYSYASAVAIESDEKIVAAGYGLVRLKKDGTLDSTFSYDGKVITNDITGIAIVNGQLYAVGFIRNASKGTIASYLLNGKNGPAVALTTDTAAYVTGGTVKLTATAWDADDTISSIEFYNGPVLLYTALDTPYVYHWTNVPKGNYSLTARAINKSGQITISVAVHISVVSDKPPVVNITSPARDTNFVVSQPIVLTADAYEPGGTIRSVDFYDGSNLIFSDVTEPYTALWDSVPTGSYHITAVVTDNEGLKTISAPVHITILHNRPPIVNITSPVDGTAYAAPADIVLSANAIAHGGRIRTVKFYNGKTLIHIEENSPYVWNWKKVPEGTYTITANATDNYGRTTVSAPVTINVASTNVPVSQRMPFKNIITDINDGAGLQLAPNPVHNIINIYTTGLQQNKQTSISVISASGVIIKTIQTNSSAQTIPLNISSLAGGMYIIKIISGDSVMYKQFVKM